MKTKLHISPYFSKLDRNPFERFLQETQIMGFYILLTYGNNVVSLLTPHRLIRNCRVIRRLLLHLSLDTRVFQAFSISGPGTSSPYWSRKHQNLLRTWKILLMNYKCLCKTKNSHTLAVMNMRLLSTKDVACKDPHPFPLRLGVMPCVWLRVSSSGVQGLEAGGSSPVSTSSMLLSQGSR